MLLLRNDVAVVFADERKHMLIMIVVVAADNFF